MVSTQDKIQNLINSTNFLSISLQKEDVDTDIELDLFIENVSTIFEYIKELPQEIAFLYKAQMSEYCLILSKALESLQAHNTSIREEINLIDQKIRAHNLYAK